LAETSPNITGTSFARLCHFLDPLCLTENVPTDEVQLTQPTGEIHRSQRMIALLSAVREENSERRPRLNRLRENSLF
jgi:hypothetical protein